MAGLALLEEGVEVMIDFLKLDKLSRGAGSKRMSGIIPAVVQDFVTKEVLMLAYVNEQALWHALKNKVAAFWSTSRNELWVKGLTSGCTLELIEARVNCEQNSILYLVKPAGGRGTCHTKDGNGKYRKSCFYRAISGNGGRLVFVNKKERGIK